MDKYEYKLRAEEIKDLIAKRKFPEALKIAETIDWTRVRSVMMLCTVSDLYKINRRYEESKELLLLAYERHPGSRMIVYSLCELSIKMGEVVQAIEYYKEFVQAAPNDNGRYILQYKLYEAQDVSLEERIAVLEEFEKREYKEKWMYELAYLYHRVGLATKCVEECDQLILWFGEGRYVDKAMELKMLHAPLSAEQQAKYDETHQPGRSRTEDGSGTVSQDTRESASLYQDGMEDGGAGRQETAAVRMDTEEMVTDYSQEAQTEEEEEPLQAENSEEKRRNAEREAILRGDTMAQLADEEVEKIRIKPVDVSQYNTINLQKELAESMNELFSAEESEQLEEAAREQADQPPAVPEKTAQMQEIFFEEESDTIEKKPAEGTASGGEGHEPAKEDVRNEQPAPAAGDGQLTLADMPGMTGLQMPAAQDLAQVEVPERIASYLSQEYDGQISLVVPDSMAVEKQITGQLNIQDVLAEWERMKKENEKKRMEEVRQRVLEQTGAMFTQFEAAARDGILEQLEKEAREEQRRGKKAARKRRPEREEAVSERRRQPAEEERPEKTAGETEPEELRMSAAATGEELQKAGAESTAPEAQGKGPEAEGTVAEESEAEAAMSKAGGEEAPEDNENEEAAYENEEDGGEKEAEPDEEEAEELTEDEGEGSEEGGTGRKDGKKPEKGRAPSDVRRIRPQGKELTREEKALFGSFLTTREAREHMTVFLDALSLDAAAGNVLLTGDVGDGSMNLAKALVKYMKAADRNFSGKVAKTTGEAMNLRDLKKVLSRMPEGALVIEGAGKMSTDTMKRLIQELYEAENGVLLILEDTRRNMNKLTESCPGMEEVFDARFDITQMNNSSLVMYGRKYAESREYAIDEMGVLELYTRIEDMQTADHSVTPAEVREIVDEAIDRANKKTVGHFFDILVGKRYDEEDMIVLHEKDFM